MDYSEFLGISLPFGSPASKEASILYKKRSKSKLFLVTLFAPTFLVSRGAHFAIIRF
jgi:hypothetical protein